MTTAPETRHAYLTRRADEERAKGNATAAATYAAQASKRAPLPTLPPGPTLAQWRAWLGDRTPDQTDALVFLDWCFEQGIVNDEQMENAKKLVRFCGGNWMTEELTRLSATPPQS